MERTKLLLALLFVAAAFGFVFLSVRSATITDDSGPGLLPAALVKPAPDFALPDPTTGQPPFRLGERVKEGPIVLDFWASWCGPCQEELPHLESLSHRYAGRVRFVGINSSDPPAAIAAFSRQSGLTIPTLSDARHQVAALYGADALPLLIVIDRQGKVRAVMVGYDTHLDTNLPKALDTLLMESDNRLPLHTSG